MTAYLIDKNKIETDMKKNIIALATVLLAPLLVQAQGTLTFLSNLGESSAGSVIVGSDSWQAAGFQTGNNAGGYSLNSVQLDMTDALGNPNLFSVMIYKQVIGGPPVSSPGSSIGTLNGSLNPALAGTYTYTSASNITLSSDALYFIVLTAGTPVGSGAYEWSYAGANSYNSVDGWSSQGGVWTSSSGSISSWNSSTTSFPEFAINATPVPEPSVFGLFGLGSLGLLWHRRKTSDSDVDSAVSR
jgi:hypothetical protein